MVTCSILLQSNPSTEIWAHATQTQIWSLRTHLVLSNLWLKAVHIINDHSMPGLKGATVLFSENIKKKKKNIKQETTPNKKTPVFMISIVLWDVVYICAWTLCKVLIFCIILIIRRVMFYGCVQQILYLLTLFTLCLYD